VKPWFRAVSLVVCPLAVGGLPERVLDPYSFSAEAVLTDVRVQWGTCSRRGERERRGEEMDRQGAPLRAGVDSSRWEMRGLCWD
jgi:hypothetical protein